MATHGKKTVFKLDDSGGVLTDISTKLKNVDMPQEAELLETTTFQASAKTYIVGFKDNKLSLQGVYDSAIDLHMNSVLGQDATLSFEYGPEGSGSGAPKYTGECILVKFQKTSAVNAVSGFSAELQITGDVTRTTYA